MILFLDPGKTTGWALFGEDGVEKDFGQLEGLDKLQDQLTLWLGNTAPEEKITLVVFENYILRNDATENMNNHQKEGHQITLRAVGVIEMACKMTNTPFKKVPTSEKEAGYKHFGIPKAPKHQHHDSHWRDALAIGKEHFLKAGKLKIKRRPIT